MMAHSDRNCGLTMCVLQRARRISDGYVDGRPFSVELAAAVRSFALSLVTLVTQFNKSMWRGKRGSPRGFTSLGG